MRSVQHIGLIYILLSIVSYAGLTDFKTIEKANQAYEAKEYGKSAALLEDIKKSNATEGIMKIKNSLLRILML